MTENFTDWIGRSLTRRDDVTGRLMAEYREAMGEFLFAPSDPNDCPPGFHFGLAPATPAYADTGPDGAERKGLFLPPIPLPRRMWAGGMIESFAPVRLGQHVTRTSSIADIKYREGSAGRLYVLSVQHEIAADGALLVRERQDLVFREGAPKAVAAPTSAATPPAGAWIVDATPLRLFRFSAFTYNGHRIHYDHHYAAEEGYPDLVVHGPMQAALMLNRLAADAGEVPQRFDYRCVAPLFAGGSFSVVSDAKGAARIIRADGVITAEGQAHARGTA